MSIQYLEQGLTNDNYLLTFPDKQHVIRLPKPGNIDLFDYHLEALVLEQIKDLNLDVHTLYYNADSGIKISNYIPNAKHFSPEYIVEATNLIKKLHQSKIHVQKTFDIQAHFNQYQHRNITPLFNTSFAHGFIDKAKTLSHENHVLCHNDCVEGNFLFTQTDSYLIDYEYAMENHPYFDLMSLITENDIQDPEQRRLIYDTYFDDDEIIDDEALFIFEIAQHVLWCEWASFMYNEHHDQIYYDIAQLKYQRLLEAWNKHKPGEII
ncbi:phosphotransferase [Erysipelothrix urinaevulpis]|uniref:phosphotransferase n=1 Tax=Erysipelothrix urinaevulpis TaxID=2683717 RepID=UPI0039EE409B